jgi:hypothetical protein
MSAIGDCQRPCPIPAPVNIPGTPGASPITNTTANLTLPAVGANVEVLVLSTAGMVAGQNVIIAGPANFKVVSVDSPTSFTGEFLGLPGDLDPAAVISYGAEVTIAGQPGTPGAAGENGYTQTTSAFQVPSAGQNVTIPVLNSACFVAGQNVIVGGVSNAYGSGTGSANFSVASINGPTSITLTFLGYANDVPAGTTFNSGATVTSAGQAGANAYTTTTAQFTVPSIGSTVQVSVADNRWMVVGQNVFVAGPANFKVVSKTGTGSVLLSFLGNINDLAPGNVIPGGSGVSPGGQQALPTGQNIAAYGSGTAYNLTGSYAPVVFGTTSPSVTLPATAGPSTWLILGRVNYGMGDTQGGAVVGVIGTKLSRTNNSPADLAQSTTESNFQGSASSADFEDMVVDLPPVVYTTQTSGDTIVMQAQVVFSTSSMTIPANEASIIAIRIA